MLTRRNVLSAATITAAALTLRSTRLAAALAQPAPGDLLYEANWWLGWDGWPSALGWQVFDGQYLNDGSGSSYTLFATCPYVPGDNNVSNYAVEAELRIDSRALNSSVALVARSRYFGMIYHANESFSSMSITRDSSNGWDKIAGGENVPVRTGEQHTYRLEVRGNRLTLKLDDATVAQATDNRHLAGGEGGLLCKENQVSVSAFRIIAL